MVLDFEYGVNTGNRFLDFVDHDEDPEEFIARQKQNEEKQKKSTKDTKPVTSTSNKKATNKTTTTTTTSTTNVSSNTTKTNKENLTGKSTNTDQRRQQSAVFSDNNNQQTRPDSGRGGGGRGFPRRGGSAGQDRPAYEGGNRGGGQQRSQRFNKFEGQPRTNETSGFEQGGEAWGNETGNENQSFGGYRGRGRGGPRRGNFEGGRGDGRGRGRGGRGRGNFNNRNFEEGSQQQQQQQAPQEGSGWQQSAESNFDNTRSQSARTGGQELDTDVSPQERPFEPDITRRGGRGHYRARTFHNNRNYGGDRQNQYEGGEGGQGGHDEYRQNRRQYDRQPRTNLSGVKPVEKKDGEGAHNWGNPAENPDEHPVSDEITETTAAQTAPQSKDWAQQVDEAEKQMTLDEYKKQLEAKKKAHQEKVPQFNRRTAGEGEDPKVWKEPEQVYQKKNDDDETEEAEDESGAEESGSGEEEIEEEQISGKKKVITIPLRFKPIEVPRGPAGSYSSRGGPRRGSGRYHDRPNRDEQQPIPNSPNQQQPFSSQPTGEYQNDEQQQPQQQQPPQQQQQQFYRGGQRGGGGSRGQGSGRGEYRRPYGNSNRGSRGGYNRSSADPNAPDIDNRLDFPTLPKQSNV